MKESFQNPSSPVIPAPACNSYAVSIAGRKAGIYLNRFPIKSGMTKEPAGMIRRGQSLIEILIAISAITIVLTALVSSATRSLSGSVFARTQALATKTAEEQMEKVRAYRDRNGLENITCTSMCYLDDSLQILIGQLAIDVLKVWFTVAAPGNCPANNRQVTVISQWTDRAVTPHQAKLTSCFSLWQ